jgi:hypothetical protein
MNEVNTNVIEINKSVDLIKKPELPKTPNKSGSGSESESSWCSCSTDCIRMLFQLLVVSMTFFALVFLFFFMRYGQKTITVLSTEKGNLTNL